MVLDSGFAHVRKRPREYGGLATTGRVDCVQTGHRRNPGTDAADLVAAPPSAAFRKMLISKIPGNLEKMKYLTLALVYEYRCTM